jgi:hypothetical protein
MMNSDGEQKTDQISPVWCEEGQVATCPKYDLNPTSATVMYMAELKM